MSCSHHATLVALVVAVLASSALFCTEVGSVKKQCFAPALLRWFQGDTTRGRAPTDGNEWNPTDSYEASTPYCNIPRVSAASLSREAFAAKYLEKEPVIIVGATNIEPFTRATSKFSLLAKYGNYSVILSSANKNSYAKKEVLFREYVDAMRTQPLDASGASSWYLFGDNKHKEWNAVFSLYELPQRYMYGPYSSLSFGIGPDGSGVPFHTHGHVFNEVFYGRKRWWLQAPDKKVSDDEGPRFDPNNSSIQWLTYLRPTYTTAEAQRLLECVCHPGEMIYIPSFWHHATLNIGETVFMANFV